MVSTSVVYLAFPLTLPAMPELYRRPQGHVGQVYNRVVGEVVHLGRLWRHVCRPSWSVILNLCQKLRHRLSCNTGQVTRLI